MTQANSQTIAPTAGFWMPVATKVAIAVVVLAVLAGLNWGVGRVVVTAAYGGAAEVENIRGDQHFLVNHGRLTEVDERTFWAVHWYWLASDMAAAVAVVAVPVAFTLSRRAIRKR